jgi:uncharacterized membrane protein
MTAATQTDRTGRPWFTLKRLAFAVLALLTLATLYEHETPLLNAADPEWVHIAPFKWWLLPHIITAAIALVVGPFQFSTTLRQRSLTLHRWMGRIYVCAVLVASAIAVYIGVAFEVPANRWLMGSMAGLWFAVTAFAWLAVRHGRIDQHRLWIARSYCLTFTFVTTRFIPDLVLPHMGYVGVTTLYWVLIVISLILPDLLLNGDALWGRPKRKGRPATSDRRGHG